ncbi:energy transducer TonB [bacterium]|nr:energy transducer TonB [bacterium]
MRDSPTKQLKLQYKKNLEVGLVVSLIVITFLLQAFKKFEATSKLTKTKMSKLEIQEVPQTQQQKQAAAPSRPTVPIATEDEDLIGDEDIDFSMFDFDQELELPPPPEEDDDMFVFVPYDEPPQPIGGFAAIQKKLVYPEIARKAGVEGRVTVQAQVDVDGSVIRTKVVQSLGPNGCDEAAIEAIRSVKWKPAKQRDRAVKVWIAVPVDFKLR